MSSLVLELQKEALDPSLCVSDLLRKALVVSKKLGISEIEDWISKELNGYEGGDVPEYRWAYGRVMVDDPHRGMIPVVFEYAEKEEMLSKMPFISSAAHLEHLYGDGSSDANLLLSYNPKLGKRLMEGMRSRVPPVLQVQRSELHKVLDAIRNIILNWALKLEENGIVGDGMSFTREERDVATGVAYNVNHFYGNVSHSQVQQGSEHSSQSQHNEGLDVRSLLEMIDGIKKSIPDTDLKSEEYDELIGELDTIAAQAKSPKPKTSIIRECLLSVKSILEGATGGAIVQYLPQITAYLVALNA